MWSEFIKEKSNSAKSFVLLESGLKNPLLLVNQLLAYMKPLFFKHVVLLYNYTFLHRRQLLHCPTF